MKRGDNAGDRWVLAQENADGLLDGDEDAALDVLLMPGTQPFTEHARFKLSGKCSVTSDKPVGQQTHKNTDFLLKFR